MALTKEDLQAISELMDAKLEPAGAEMRKGFEQVHGDISALERAASNQ